MVHKPPVLLIRLVMAQDERSPQSSRRFHFGPAVKALELVFMGQDNIIQLGQLKLGSIVDKGLTS